VEGDKACLAWHHPSHHHHRYLGLVSKLFQEGKKEGGLLQAINHWDLKRLLWMIHPFDHDEPVSAEALLSKNPLIPLILQETNLPNLPHHFAILQT